MNPCVRAKSLLPCPTLLQSHKLWPTRPLCPWILQARILEWVAMPSSRRSSQPRDQTHISYISRLAGGLFTTRAVWEAPKASM